jgi:serine/threonine protein kinase/Tol biopolymer transport system component
VSEPGPRSHVGSRIAHYEVIARLGAGGMGEVYRARDSNLGRDVAIKILPSIFLDDPDRRARFEREARVLASINHPHIGSIYGIESAPGVRAIVLELVEGQTLAERLIEGPLPPADALEVARQIADALEAAHEKGIVHRDLKPANIMFAASGGVKVLDFGLAKLEAPEAPGSSQSQSPTLTAVGTVHGIILGTAPYLSPEQARGRAVDKRTDIWAFGCVLFEMLTGRSAFVRETISDTISAILTQEPDWAALPQLPPTVRSLLQRCLAKDPRRRLHDIADARIEIEEAVANPSSSGGSTARIAAGTPQTAPSSRSLYVAIGVMGLALAATSLLAFTLYRRSVPPPAPPVRFAVVPPGPIVFTPTSNLMAFSPDGRWLAFAAAHSGGQAVIWTRGIDSLDARPLPGTEGARHPFWSPDSRHIAFFAAGGLIKRVPIDGGAVQMLTTSGLATGTGGTWNRDDVILFSSTSMEIQRISAHGNVAPVPVTVGKETLRSTTHAFPHFLPDGKRFLFLVQSQLPERTGIYVKDLESGEERLVVPASSNVQYVAPGYLLYARDGVLLAQPFDATRAVTTGPSFSIAENVAYFPESSLAAFSASDTGSIAFRSARESEAAGRLVWFDRRGNRLGEIGEPAAYRNPRLSPDGARVAVETVDSSGNRDISILDVARGVPRRFTFETGRDASPIWSRDGKRIAWQGPTATLMRASDGTGEVERVHDQPWIPDDWQPDNGAVVLHPGAPRQVYRIAVDGDRTPQQVLEGRGVTTHARVSPDGKWIAFANADSGRFEVFLENYPKSSGRWPVSSAGGLQPKWHPDGDELFYLGLDGRLMAVPLALGALPEIGRPQPLFQTGVEAITGFTWHQYDVTRDGHRFLVNVAQQVTVPVTVLLNWPAASGPRR